jgi:hypothetical protein
MAYELKSFDPSTTKSDRVWLIIGSRGTGKSVLLKNLLYHTRERYDLPVAMTATTSTVNTLKEFMPYRLIYRNGYNYARADAMLDVCKKLVAEGKERHVVAIQDDVMYDTGVLKSPSQTEIHFNGRHANLTQFSTTQYCMTCPPGIRGNIDYVLALRETTLNIRRKLYEYFFGVFPSFKIFNQVFMSYTQNYGALVIDKTNPTLSIESSVYYYRSQLELPPFRIGKPIFFRWSKKIERLKAKKNASC